MLNRTKFDWGQILVAALVAYLIMLNLLTVGCPSHNLPLTWHAASEYGGLLEIVKRFRLSHKSMGLASMERVTV